MATAPTFRLCLALLTLTQAIAGRTRPAFEIDSVLFVHVVAVQASDESPLAFGHVDWSSLKCVGFMGHRALSPYKSWVGSMTEAGQQAVRRVTHRSLATRNRRKTLHQLGAPAKFFFNPAASRATAFKDLLVRR